MSSTVYENHLGALTKVNISMPFEILFYVVLWFASYDCFVSKSVSWQKATICTSHLLIHSRIQWPMFIYSLTQSSIFSFICLYVYFSIYLFMHSLQSILPLENVIFLSSQVQISSKILPHIPIFFPLFCHQKMRPFQQCMTVTAVNLTYFMKSCPISLRLLSFTFLKEKPWIFLTLHSDLNHHRL